MAVKWKTLSNTDLSSQWLQLRCVLGVNHRSEVVLWKSELAVTVTFSGVLGVLRVLDGWQTPDLSGDCSSVRSYGRSLYEDTTVGKKNVECQKSGPVFSPAGVPDCFCVVVQCSAVRWVNNAIISRPFHAENWGLVPWLLRERDRVRERSHTAQAANTERVGDPPVSKPSQTCHTVDVEIPVCPIWWDPLCQCR